jgi:hypothetical protein
VKIMSPVLEDWRSSPLTRVSRINFCGSPTRVGAHQPRPDRHEASEVFPA